MLYIICFGAHSASASSLLWRRVQSATTFQSRRFRKRPGGSWRHNRSNIPSSVSYWSTHCFWLWGCVCLCVTMNVCLQLSSVADLQWFYTGDAHWAKLLRLPWCRLALPQSYRSGALSSIILAGMQEVFAMFICHDGICSISFYWALRCKRSSVEIAFPSVRPSVRPSVYCLSVTCLAVSKRRIFFYRICLLYLIGQESCSVVKKARKYLQSLFPFFLHFHMVLHLSLFTI